MLYCSLSSLILPSISMSNFYIFSERFCLKHKGLTKARVVSIAKYKYGFEVRLFIKIHKVSKVNI